MNPGTERIQVSPSRLKTWLTCPLRWAAVYLEGKPIQVTPAMAFGSAIHKALEAHHRSKWLGEVQEDLLEVFDSALTGETDPDQHTGPRPRVPPQLSEKERDTMRDQARELLSTYVDRYEAEEVSAAEMRLEAPLLDPDTGDDLGVDLVGIVDLVTTEGALVDVKTSARATSELQAVLSHALQVDTYRYLMAHHDPERGSVPAEIRTLIRGRNCRLEVTPVPERSSRTLVSMIRAYSADVRAGVLLPRPGILCSDSCPAIEACRGIHAIASAA